MTSPQVPTSSRPSWLRARSSRNAAAVLAVLALASCSGSTPTSSASPSPGVSLAAQVPAPPKACAVSAVLVNSCRPWLGAVVGLNPAAPPSSMAQWAYLERLLDHHLDIFRDFNAPGGTGRIGSIPLNANELYFVKQPGTYLDVNWKPADSWVQADGGDATVNASIKQAADNIKAVAPHKIFLTIWSEPQNDVSGGSNCPDLKGSAGTPAQYRQMWRNVENIFQAQGVHNVVWAMDYQTLASFYCLLPQLWPGNDEVDWVLYDSYDHDNKTGSSWSNTVGRFYQELQQVSSPGVDFDAKPWGLGEYGVCGNKNAANARQYFVQARQSIESGTYPKLEMYNMFTSLANHPGKACLPDYDYNGQLDATKNSDVKGFVNSSVFNR
jgi:hypothetical protein